MNLWRDNEVHSKSVEEKVIGYEEDAEETHDEEKEDQKEGDVTPNFEIDDDTGDPGRYEYNNEMSKDEVLHTIDIKSVAARYA